MKKLKDFFTSFRMQTLSEANLEPWRLEVKQVLNLYHLKSLSFILFWEWPFLKKMNFCKYLDLYRKNASATWLRCVFKNLFQMVNIENKNVTTKELFSKSVNLNMFKWVCCCIWFTTHFIRMFRFYTSWKHWFSDVLKEYKIGTWGKKWIKQHSVSLTVEKLC